MPADTESLIAELERVGKLAAPAPWQFDSWEDGNDPECGEGYAHISQCDTMDPTGIQHVNDYDGYWNDWRFILTARNRWDAILTALRENIALRAENAALRAMYADNWHDPPQIGDHKWVKMVFRGQGLPMQQEGGDDDAE